MLVRGPLVWLVGIASMLSLIACGGNDDKFVEAPPPEILSFTSSASEIAEGEAATLSWRTKGVTSIDLFDGAGAEVDLGSAAAAQGSVEVSPGESTTYRLVAHGTDGASVSAEVAIEVRPGVGGPTIDSFTATPEVVGPGDEVTLAWTVRDADSVTIEGADGTPIELPDGATTAGEVTIPVTATTTYRLTASNAGGEVSAEATVTLAGAPQGTFRGPTAAILSGAPAVLVWTTQGATSVRITDAAGTTVVYGGSDRLSGEITVNPEFTTEYVLAATGPGGELSMRTAVSVRPVIERFEIVTQGPVRVGDEVEIEWTVRGATELVIRTTGGSHTPGAGELQSGSAILAVGLGGGFTLEALSGSLVETAQASIEITRAPRIRSFTVDPNEVTASPETPAEVTIAWEVDGAVSLVLESLTDGPIEISGLSGASDSVTVEVTATTTFRLTATNDFGTDLVERELHVFEAPRQLRFDALPSVADVGEEIILTWETEDAVSIVLERDGVTLPPTALTGTYSDTMGAASATYVLRSVNSTGFEVVSDPRIVTLGTPAIINFGADSTEVPVAAPIRLSWRNAGGQNLRVVEGGIDVCTVTDLAAIQEGGCTVTAPGTVGTYTYTLHLESGLGVQATPATVVVHATAGPNIRSFTAAPQIVSAGQPVVFTWTVSNDVAGVAPTLVIEDDLGGTVDVTTAGGTTTITPATAGMRTYTLTASTPGTTPHVRQAQVDVRGVPVIELSASPREIASGGNPVVSSTIAWTVQSGGTQLKLYELVGNVPAQPPIFETSDPLLIESGSQTVNARAGINWFRLEVDNGAGTVVSEDIDVRVDMPVVSLNTDKSQIHEGEEVTFVWSTAMVDSWSMDFQLPLITVGTDAALDVVNSPTSQRLVLSSSSTLGFADVAFPGSFSFPWNGAQVTSARISMNGWLGFAPSGTSGGSTTNAYLPSSTTTNALVSLAPFWDSLDLESDDTLTGAIYVDSGFDTRGTYVVFHWHDFATSSNTQLVPASLNFQVILWEDGTFAYRYGEMKSGDADSTTLSQQRADGLSASIGYQFNGSTGYTWSHNSDVPGGLSNKSLTFDVSPLPPAGSRTVRLFANSTAARNTTYTLSGSSGSSNVADSVTLASVGHLNVNWAWVDANEPGVNEPFTFRWSLLRGTLAEIFDGAGGLIYSQTGTGTGTHTRQEGRLGPHDYTLRFSGERASDVRVMPFRVHVYAPLAIDSFSASTGAIDAGQSATLSWTLTGAASVELLANGVPVNISSQPLSGGTITVSPAVSTIYTLNVDDGTGTGRMRTAEARVRVRTAAITQVTASPPLLPPGGGAVTLNWTSTGATHVTLLNEPRVSPATGPYVDISADPNATELFFPTATTGQQHRLPFPGGFSFPWYGRQVSSAVVSSAGAISFRDDAHMATTNGPLPDTADDDVHLAVFWDALYPSRIHYLLGNDGTNDYLVVQWKQARFSSTNAVDDVNFQVRLYSNGNFEYRYGSMVGSTAARGDGNSATIGFQNWEATSGTTISNNTAVLGGLSNTGWFVTWAEPPSGQQVVTVGGATTFNVCAHDGLWADCQLVPVEAMDAGTIQISEIMARPVPGVGTPGEYFEVRNVSGTPLDIEGWAITSGAESHTISTGSAFILQPGQIVTFARSGASTNGGFTPDYVYGNAITLDPNGDTLSIGFLGGAVDTVTWNAAWFTTPGASLTVEPIRLIGDGTKNDLLANWCISNTALGGSGQMGTPGTIGLVDSCESTHYAVVPTDASDFIDITATGTIITTQDPVADYNQFATVPAGIGFPFPFFGDLLAANTPVGITQQGFITFDALTEDQKTNRPIPSSQTPNGLIAVFWDELGGNVGRNMLTELRTVGAEQVRIYQWINYRRFATGDSHLVFQVQLWSNGDIASIIQHFDPPVGGPPPNPTQALQLEGGSATIGIEAMSGTLGIQYSHLEQILTGNSGVLYQRR